MIFIAAGMALASAAAEETAAPAAVTAVHCGHLIDTAAGKLLGETTIVTDGKRVREVPWLPGEPPPVPHDRSGRPDLPAGPDRQPHPPEPWSGPTQYVDEFHWNVADYAVRSTVYARRTLLAGFTTVRNLGEGATRSSRCATPSIRVFAGPRIFTAGVPIGSTGGHADSTDGYRDDLAGDPGPTQGIINSPEDAAKAVRLHYKRGDDLIKIMPSGGVLDQSSSGDNAQLTLEEIKAVVGAAHDYGFTVAAHAHGAEGDSSRRHRWRRLHRARHLHGRAGHEADEGARHLVRADHHCRRLCGTEGERSRATTRPRSPRKPPRSVR